LQTESGEATANAAMKEFQLNASTNASKWIGKRLHGVSAKLYVRNKKRPTQRPLLPKGTGKEKQR